MPKRSKATLKKKAKRLIIIGALLALIPALGFAESLRNISVVSFTYYFDNSFWLSAEDVFIIRLIPELSLQLKVGHYDDLAGNYENVFFLGTILSFNPNLYLDACYGLGLDASLQFSHRAELNFNYENDASLLQIGARAFYLPKNEYFYIIPSAGGKFLLSDWLYLFNKIFLSLASASTIAGSYWVELGWITGQLLTIRTGATVSWTATMGYAALIGLNFTLSPNFLIRYHFQFLANCITYDNPQQAQYGIENGLFIDIRF